MENDIPVYVTKMEKEAKKIIPDYRLSNELMGYSKQERYANVCEWGIIIAIAVAGILLK